MGKIKSAWEIALERTESIQMDKNKLKYKTDVDTARRLAGRFIADDEPIDEKELRDGLSALDRISHCHRRRMRMIQGLGKL